MTRWSPGGAALAAALCVMLGAAPAAGAQEPQLNTVLNRASKSVVKVSATFSSEGAPFPVEKEDAVCLNTGFFVGTQGEVLTSLLGLAGCGEVTVLSPDGRRVPARVAAVDQRCGVALLKTDLTGTVPLEPVERPVPGGSWVFLAVALGPVEPAMASPGSAQPTKPAGGQQGGEAGVLVAPGLVSPRRASVRLQGVEWQDLMVVSAAVRTGAAAAPLLDGEGRLAGVVLGVATARGAADYLALPADRLTPILDELKAGRSRRLGWLGVCVIQDAPDREGARVKATLEGSPAHAAGIRAGDILLQVDEQVVDSPTALAQEIAEAGPGRTVTLRLLREGQIKAVPVRVGTRPVLICGGLRRAGDRTVRLRWPKASSPFLSAGPGVPDLVTELLEENRQLRERVQRLEETGGQAEQPGPQPKTTP